jgi:hypothetical protein
MLELAAERADGAHPLLVPVEQTPFACQHLGPEPFLVVEQAAVLTTDPAEGRRIGRGFAMNYLALPNYVNNLRRLGWGDADLAGDGSARDRGRTTWPRSTADEPRPSGSAEHGSGQRRGQWVDPD